LTAAEQHTRLRRVGARAVLTDAAASDAGDCPEMVIAVNDSGALQINGTPASAMQDPGLGLTEADALIMFTSGTTAMPKMVPWTHAGLSAAMANVATAYALQPSDRTVGVMPMFHGHGLVAGLLAPLSTGGVVGLPIRGRFSAQHFFDEAKVVDANWLTAVPTIHQILLEALTSGTESPVRLRFLRSCSAPLPPEVARRLEEVFDAPMLPAYGMTEATHQACAATLSADLPTRINTVGLPVGSELRIAASDGSASSIGMTGEVWLRGPAIARGYLNNAQATADTFADGWLRTGDLGSVDAGGALTLRGRIKNIINRGGEKISPEHVEDILLAHPDVTQAAVFGVSEPKLGEKVGAVVILRAGTAYDADELRKFCASQLARFEVPEHILCVDELPVTAKGSVDRQRLADAFGPDIKKS
jgi:acyl-CoA synthetase (AMP-forming)/AMP-acid ligase II